MKIILFPHKYNRAFSINQISYALTGAYAFRMAFDGQVEQCPGNWTGHDIKEPVLWSLVQTELLNDPSLYSMSDRSAILRLLVATGNFLQDTM